MLRDLEASKLKVGLSFCGRGGVSRGVLGVEQADEDLSTMWRLPSSSVSSAEDKGEMTSLQFTTDNLLVGGVNVSETGCRKVRVDSGLGTACVVGWK